MQKANETAEEVKQKLADHEKTLNASGVNAGDLLSWSNPTSNESWASLEIEYQALVDENKTILEQIGVLNSAADKIAERVTQVVNKAATPSAVLKADKSGSEITSTPSNPLLQELIEQYRTLTEKINALSSQAKSYPDEIKKSKKEYLRRKRIVEETRTKELIEGYRAADKTAKDKTEEKQKVDSKVTALPQNEKTAKDIADRRKEKDEELANLGKLEKEDLLETQALQALKTALPSAGRQACNPRISEAKKGTLLKPEIAADSEWVKQQHSDEILRCVQIIFGDEVLLPYPPETHKALAEQVQALLKLDKYKKLWIDAIGNKTMEQIDEKVIDKIVENMRITALGLKKDLIK